MVEWCPKCHTMLSPGLEKCPACGKRLKKGGDAEFSTRDVLGFTLYLLGIAMIPILIAIAIGVICVLVGRYQFVEQADSSFYVFIGRASWILN